MNLFNHYGGIFYRRTAEQVEDPHIGINLDYWFMAKRTTRNSEVIDLLICTNISDHVGNRFQCKSIHQGNYHLWKETIKQRMEAHMLKVGVDKLMTNRIIRDIEICKSKMIPFNRKDFLHKT